MPGKSPSATTADGGPISHGEFRLGERMRAQLAVAAGGLGVIADQVVVSASSFLATVIVGRVCGQHELGVFGLAVSIFWLAAGIPNALVWTPYTARAAHLPHARRAAFSGSSLLHAILIGLAISVLLSLTAAASRAFAATPGWFAPMCLALVPFTFMMLLREHARRYNLAHLRSSDLLAIDVPIAVLQVLLLLALASWGRLSANSALLVIAISCGYTAVWLWNKSDQFRIAPRRAAAHWSHNQRFGRWLLVVSLMWLVGDSSYRWLVVMLHGTEALGQFAAAQNIVLLLNPVLLTVTNLAQSLTAQRLAAEGVASLRRNVARSTLHLAIGAGAALAILAAVGGPLVQFAFGSAYGGLEMVVATLCLGMFARIVSIPVDAATVSLKRGRLLVTAAAVRLTVIVGAGVPLIYWRSLEGVGYAMATSALAGAAVEWWSFCREEDGRSG